MFKLFVRSALEPAVPLWAVKLISGPTYRDYIGAIKSFKLDTLDARRKKLCLKFAKKSVKSERFKHWFKLKPSMNTRNKEKYQNPKDNTKRFERSAIPYLTDLLNEDT